MMGLLHAVLALAGSFLLLQDAAGLVLSTDGGKEAEKPTKSKKQLPPKEELDVNWPDFIAGHDLQWTLKDMPTNWKESGFVGNGKLGAMVWVDAEHGNRLRVEVGASSLFDDRLPGDDLAMTPDDAVCNRARLPVGRFYLNLDGPGPEHFKMRLRLYDAEIKGSIGNSKSNASFRIIASADSDVIIIRTSMQGVKTEPWKTEPWTWEAANLTKMVQGCVAKRWKQTPHPTFQSDGWMSLWQQTHLNGKSHAVSFGYTDGHPGEKVLVVGVSGVQSDATAVYEATKPVMDALKANVEVLTRNHQNWWHNFYPDGAFVRLGEKMLDSFYWVNIYKAASASRPGRPLYDLQGPWPIEGTAWPDIHWDLNIQLTYMPFASAGRLSLMESLWEFLDRNKVNLIMNAPAAWRHDSAAAPSLASGPDARASCNAKQWGGSIERQGTTCVVAPPSITGNLLWTLQVLHGAYETTLDPRYARRMYPLLRRAVNFHMHMLEKGADGLLHLPGSMSPEYGAPGRVPVQADPNYDLALFRWGLTTMLSLCDGPAESLCTQELENVAEWRKAAKLLAPYAEHEQEGYTIYRGQRLQESHRHFSHLLMFYPLRLTDIGQEKDRDVAQRSLDHWVDKVGRLQGYSFVAASAMSTMLDRPEASMGNLTHLLHKYITRNTFYSEGGPNRPVAETPMFAVTAIQELLLTHTSDELRVFAGLTERVSDAAFYGLRAPGGIKVSAERKNGATTFVVVEGATEGIMEPTNNLTRPITIRPGFAAGSRIRFERPKGTSVAIIEAQHTLDGNALVHISGLARGARLLLWPSTLLAKPQFRVAAF